MWDYNSLKLWNKLVLNGITLLQKCHKIRKSRKQDIIIQNKGFHQFILNLQVIFFLPRHVKMVGFGMSQNF